MKNIVKYDATNIRWLGYHTELKKFFEGTAILPDVLTEKNTKVMYATPSVALAKYSTDMTNGLTDRPVVTFYLDNEETTDEATSFLYNIQKYEKQEDESYIKYSYNKPLIKKLTYSCHVFATKVSDCDYLLTLLELESNRYKPYGTLVNGRPAQFYLDNVKSNVDTSFEGKKIVYSTFEVTVPRAMILPVEIETDAARIEKINTYLYGEIDTLPKEDNGENI